MKLLIDAGNSRLKWAVDGPDYWKTGVCPRSEFGQSLKDTLPESIKINRVLASSTRNQSYNQQLSELTKQLFDQQTHFIKAERRQSGVINRYGPSQALGADRWASLVAARYLSTSPSVVIDCGTAVTVDALNADGIFEGGVIFPGISLALESLNQTDNLHIAQRVTPSVFALSTEQAMYSGVVCSIAAGIDGIVQQMRKTLGYTVNVYLSGGDAQALEPLLDHSVINKPDMVLIGLKIIADDLQ